MEEMITIPKDEYELLVDAANKLSCLEACGVDNWCGWNDAMEMYHSEEE